jgi:hypothetical protein
MSNTKQNQITQRILDINHFMIKNFSFYTPDGNLEIDTTSEEYQILKKEILFLENLLSN